MFPLRDSRAPIVLLVQIDPMATAPTVAVCGTCGRERSPLLCLARGGELHSVCRICFLGAEVVRLAGELETGPVTAALEDGLEALYLLTRETVASAQRDAAQGEAQSEAEGEGEA